MKLVDEGLVCTLATEVRVSVGGTALAILTVASASALTLSSASAALINS